MTNVIIGTHKQCHIFAHECGHRVNIRGSEKDGKSYIFIHDPKKLKGMWIEEAVILETISAEMVHELRLAQRERV